MLSRRTLVILCGVIREMNENVYLIRAEILLGFLFFSNIKCCTLYWDNIYIKLEGIEPTLLE